ncbi:MAG: PEP-CTERM sorting domain-containing protein [Planctomycetota bacterium]
MKSFFAIAGAAALAACALTSTASADLIPISSMGFGIEGNGAFTGSIAYSGSTLTITLTNDLASAAGGKITGVVFNIHGSATAVLSSTTHAAFADLGASPSASPFGTFEAGAAMGGSWAGGGSPAAGIAIGGTGVFTFHVSGADAGILTAASFIDGDGVNFAVRFRGFANGGSDKVAGHLVPAPGSLALLGLAGLGLRRRR